MRRIQIVVGLLSAVSVWGVLTTRSQSSDPYPAPALEKSSARVLEELTSADSVSRQSLARSLHSKLLSTQQAVVKDSTVYLLYFGDATRVSVPSDLNGWNPAADMMERISHTTLFYLAKKLHPAARFEYKIVVDSVWILDPLNQRQAMGGYGPNSEIWMPQYRPPREIEYRPEIPHGSVDSFQIASPILGRTHTVFVYLPPGYRKSVKRYPVMYVNDGGEYITLAAMPNVLDNLIAEKRIPPIVAVFVDPRTDARDASTSKRMVDYTMSISYVDFLVRELRVRIAGTYSVDHRPEQTAIMGASLGGLISTYAAFVRPDVFGLSAAQSPAYWWNNDSMITLIATSPKRDIRFYIDTGTIRDAQEKSLEMKSVLERKTYPVHYEEHPEGHNWVNWRSRISHILEYFWGSR